MMLNAYNAQGIPFPPTTNSDPAPDIHSAETEKPTPGWLAHPGVLAPSWRHLVFLPTYPWGRNDLAGGPGWRPGVGF